MNWKYILVSVGVVCLLLVVGCSMMMDMYPAKITKDLAKYTNHDPNKLNWPTGTMGTLREWLSEASLKHQLNQADIEYYAKKDNLTYSAVSSSGVTALNTAQNEVNSTFGPNGWIWPVLTLAMGGGTGLAVGALAMNQYKNSTLYTVPEVTKLTAEAAITGKAPTVL